MTMRALEIWHWLAVAVLWLVLICSGCTSARPYTAGERVALMHAVIGQAADVVSTDMALQDDRVSEQNGLWWDPDDAGSLLAGKLILVGVGCLVGEVYPDARRPIFYAIGGVGYAAAAWNVGVIIDNGVDPWGDK